MLIWVSSWQGLGEEVCLEKLCLFSQFWSWTPDGGCRNGYIKWHMTWINKVMNANAAGWAVTQFPGIIIRDFPCLWCLRNANNIIGWVAGNLLTSEMKAGNSIAAATGNYWISLNSPWIHHLPPLSIVASTLRTSIHFPARITFDLYNQYRCQLMRVVYRNSNFIIVFRHIDICSIFFRSWM